MDDELREAIDRLTPVEKVAFIREGLESWLREIADSIDGDRIAESDVADLVADIAHMLNRTTRGLNVRRDKEGYM